MHLKSFRSCISQL
uniref:Uncharacterized protein n=1 Tax=Anguilla anguilla TaxID=7936 RepID=A0A0E9S2T7_ANGAN